MTLFRNVILTLIFDRIDKMKQKIDVNLQGPVIASLRWLGNSQQRSNRIHREQQVKHHNENF